MYSTANIVYTVIQSKPNILTVKSAALFCRQQTSYIMVSSQST